MKQTERTRVRLTRFALALALGAGIGSAPAQTILEVAGDSTIGDEILTSNALPTSGSNFAAEGGVAFSSSILASPPVEVTTSGAVTLKFDHRYFIEDSWDGGAVFVSVNGAPATYLPGTAFSANGYIGNTLANAPNTAWEDGEDVFYNKSAGYDDPAMIESVANLGTFDAGDVVSVEFHIRWDGGYFEPTTNWEIGRVQIADAAPSTLLDVTFTTDGTAGFTVESVNSPVGPWAYPKPVSLFELDADSDTSDRYAPSTPGSVIDLNDAALATELLSGQLEVGDTFTLFDLSGGTSLTGSYESLTLPAGTWDVSSFETDGTITLLLLPPLIEEAFDYPAGNLADKDGGNGFSGPWTSKRGNTTVKELNNFWGSLGTSGNRINPPSWNYISRPFGSTLSDAGLMANGSTVWFSYVMDILGQNTTNLDFNFALCSDDFYWDGTNGSYGDRTNLASGEAIGVSNFRPNIKGAIWQDTDEDTIAEVTHADTTLTLQNSGPNSRALIVGKIEWGATDTDPEKLTLYAPDRDLNLGTPILDAWATPALDQSLFDRISMEWKDSQPSIDEIRFGATSDTVLPPDINAPLLVSTIPANNEPQASGVYFVATFNEPIAIGTGNIRLIDTAGPTTLTTIDVTDATQVAVSATDQFSLVITPTAVPTPGNTYYIEFDAGAAEDLGGNPFAGISGPDTWSFTASDTAPTVVSIENTPAASTIYGTPVITYSVTFDKFYMDDATVGADDFVNAGTAGITVGAVTRASGPLDAAVYTVDVTTTSFGTVELQVSGAISDLLGNDLAVPVNDDTVITLDAGPEVERLTPSIDDTLFWAQGGSPSINTFNASGSDKLVVVVAGEHNFNQSASGQINGITYDGEPLIKAVDVDPKKITEGGHGDTAADIWYLDNPADYHISGTIEAAVAGNGNNYVYTAIGISGVEDGVDVVASVAGAASLDLITGTQNSLVIYQLGMGGSGNTADVNIDPNSPAGFEELAAQKAGGNWAGQIVAEALIASPGRQTVSFDTAKTDVATVAAVFKAAVPPITDYDIWSDLYPDADLEDPNADLDDDGLTNDEERLFGLDPTNPASVNPIAVPLDAAAGTFSFTRRDDALTGLFSGVETSTDLVMWTEDAGAILTPGAPDAGDIETVAVTLSPGLLSAPSLFVRVVQDDGVLLAANFEDGDGGFTVATTEGSDWQFGDPNSLGFGGEVLEGNGGSTNCWGTDIGDPGEYVVPTTTKLRSPVIDLRGVAGAQLTFAHAMDLEVGDSAVVNIIEEATDTVIAGGTAVFTATDADINTAFWTAVPAIDLAAGVGMKVRIEWSFAGGTAEYLGWYIDDVTVTQTAP